jgi:hypothetical protein
LAYDRNVRRMAIWLAVVAGCYDPTPHGGIACGEHEACPRGQRCVDGVCDGTVSEIDAPLDDVPVDIAGDVQIIDGPIGACAGGDNKCLVSCVGMDPDCTTTCGDGKCVGNAGEFCGNCAMDCATTNVVCGNGQCQAGESPDCYADCGPAPWTWSAEEMQLTALVQNARTSGFTCPGGSAVTRPAYQIVAGLQPAAREWVWEMSHQSFFGMNNVSCNGRTLSQREMDGGFGGYVRSTGYATVQDAFNSWMSSTSLCPIVMSTATQASVAVALDATKAYIMVIK